MAKRTADILLSANDLTDRWILTLIIGEHKFSAALGENRKVLAELAGYPSELSGVQGF